MSFYRSDRATLAALAALAALAHVLAPLSASAQSSAPTVAAAQLEADVAPAAAAPDPLAPTDVDKPAPLAPGGTAAGEAADAAAADPVVVLVREKLAAMPARPGLGAKDDLAAAIAYYGVHSSALWTDKVGINVRGRQVAAEIGSAGDWGLDVRAFDAPVVPGATASPEELAEVEAKLTLAVLTYARHARGGRLDPSAISKRFDQKPAVFEPRSVLQGIAAADAPDAYLRGLHPRHPQFEKLRQALLALRAGGAEASTTGKDKPAASTMQVLVNMERWRWMPPDLGAFYVWNSITEQTTSVFADGKPVLTEKIVVGKTSSPTPIFSADMQFVIFHPSWGVPAGIKSHELGPKLRNSGGGSWFSFKPPASAVLRAHGLIASRGGRPVDPDSIDWSQVNINSFHFTQPAGERNVLGIVKFRFPNKHDVYMHDTTERHLFGGAVRAFSHGCMRVQNPMHLAEVLLAHDKGWSKEQVKAAERRGEQVTLSTPIPVHINYFTVTVDDAGRVVTRPDLYGLDSRVASAIEGREVKVAGAPVPREAATDTGEQPVRPSAQARRKQRAARQAASSEASPFPFSGPFGN